MSPDRTRTGRAILSHPIISLFVSLVLLIGVPVGVALWVGHDKDVKLEAQQRAFVDYQVDQAVQRCGSRQALQTVLDQVANPPVSGAAAIDLKKLPAYKELDPATRLFVDQLQAGLDVQVTPEYLELIADDYRRDYPSDDRYCATVGRATRKQLEH